MTLLTVTPRRDLATLRHSNASHIPTARALKVYPRAAELRERLTELSHAWPRPARAVVKLHVSRFMSEHEHGVTEVLSLGTVSATIKLSRASLKDPLIDTKLLGLQDVQFSAGGSYVDVVTHEWAHVLTDMLFAQRAERFLRDRQHLAESLIKLVEEEAGESASWISHMAQLSPFEWLAESFVDAEVNGESAAPTSLALHQLLHRVWNPPRRR